MPILLLLGGPDSPVPVPDGASCPWRAPGTARAGGTRRYGSDTRGAATGQRCDRWAAIATWSSTPGASGVSSASRPVRVAGVARPPPNSALGHQTDLHFHG